MNLLLSIDRNWNIGYQGDLLLRIPEDMRYFKALTVENIVIMGRKTFESLPGSRPLSYRTNIVLSSTMDSQREDIVVVKSVEELFQQVEKYDSGKVFVIGGEAIFRQLLPYCDTAYITKIDHEFPADTSMPNLDQDPAWKMTKEYESRIYQGISYRFTVYNRTI